MDLGGAGGALFLFLFWFILEPVFEPPARHLAIWLGYLTVCVCVCVGGRGVPLHYLISYNWMLDEDPGSLGSWLHLRCSQVSSLAL